MRLTNIERDMLRIALIHDIENIQKEQAAHQGNDSIKVACNRGIEVRNNLMDKLMTMDVVFE